MLQPVDGEERVSEKDRWGGAGRSEINHGNWGLKGERFGRQERHGGRNLKSGQLIRKGQLLAYLAVEPPNCGRFQWAEAFGRDALEKGYIGDSRESEASVGCGNLATCQHNQRQNPPRGGIYRQTL